MRPSGVPERWRRGVRNDSGIGERRDKGPGSRLSYASEQDLKKLYVGNLPFSATDSEVQTLFAEHGTVNSVALINDRETGRPRGFGFVEMDDDGAMKAMQSLNGYEMGGRALRVNEAEDRRGGGGQRRERW